MYLQQQGITMPLIQQGVNVVQPPVQVDNALEIKMRPIGSPTAFS